MERDREMENYLLEADDDTYHYGGKMFKCYVCENTNTYIEPFIRKEKKKLIKFYRKKRFFAVYENTVLTEIIRTMTCWSDDVIVYKIKDNIAYKYDETYHGRPYKKDEACSIDLSNFIRENNL